MLRGADQRKCNDLSVSYAGWRFSYGDCRRSEDDYTCSACDEYYCQPRGKKDVEVYGRKIRSSYIRSAQVVVGMAVSVLLISVLGIFAVMPEAPFVDVLYELTSAVGTVGLSRGLTAVLNTPAKWIVIFTMYLGRIGPLTLGAAVVSRAQKRTKDVHLAEENIMIG